MEFVPRSTDGRSPAAGVPVPRDLVVLAAERPVTVTGEQHHQDVLAGRSGRVVVVLHPSTVSRGKYAGQPGLTVVLDGRPVGELTRLMAQRYLPMVREVAARGRVAGCEAWLRADHRGVQVELRLPAVDAAPGPRVPAHAAPPPWPHPAGPRTAIAPAPIPPTPLPPAPHGSHRGRRRAVWAGAAVVGLLALAGIVGNDDQAGPARTTTVAAEVTSSASAGADEPASTSSAPTSSTAASTAPSATARAGAAGGAVVVPVERTPPPTVTRTTTTEAAPTTRAAAPPPASRTSSRATRTPDPEPEADPAPARSGCDPNYSGCVPVASDVDCEGGSGNGPAYVSGPVRVTGKDVYGLDADHDGVACE
jgi:hypothetical protein